MKTRATGLIICMLSVLCMNSCTKSDLPEPSSGYHRVRLYDDTLANARNHSIRIAAGEDRLFMTYGCTFEQIMEVGGSITFPPPAKSVWMLTDNEGNLIRRDTFPPGQDIGDVIALPDNSFFIVTYTGVPNFLGGLPWSLQIMRLDPNGVMSPADSLHIPNIQLPFQQFWGIHLTPTPNGNVLIHFSYQAANGSGNYVGEMDTQGNFLWHKENIWWIDDCEITPDGGYMVSASNWDPALQATVKFIMKTNSAFDSTWSRIIGPMQGAESRTQIVAAGNGNYWLNYLKSHDGKAYSYLLELNAGGEILDSNSYPLLNSLSTGNTKSVMLLDGASGVFISHSLDYVYGNVLDQFNSSYTILDANLDITQKSAFQDQTTDKINSGCLTSDGRIACFGIVQCYGRGYYKPELLILN